jgi:glyoxylase-like metal-dependent hydrolase (beta-lactamase superfamily II)
MKKRSVTKLAGALAAVLVAVAACGGEDRSAEQLLTQAITAIGGKDAVAGITSEIVVGGGVRYEPGQGRFPGAPSLEFEFAYTTQHDVAGDRLHIEWKRSTELGSTIEYAEIVDKDIGYFDGMDNVHTRNRPMSPMLSSRVAAVRKHQRLFHPELLLRTALQHPETVAVLADASINGEAHRVVSLEDAFQPIRIFIDEQTGLVTRLETEEDDPMRGDTTIGVEFSDWKIVGDVKIPHQLTLSQSGILLHEETRSSIRLNDPLDEDLFAIPRQAHSVPDPEDAERGEILSEYLHRYAAMGSNHDFNSASSVKAERIAPGVYQFGSTQSVGVVYSLAIEMEEEIVVVEAPGDGERSGAVIAGIKERIPGKPIKWIVSTHHHDDHAAGLRTYVAEGATVVTAAANEAYYKQVFSAPHTLRPDALQQRPAEARIQAVGSQPFVISDGQRKVSVFPLAFPLTAARIDGVDFPYVEAHVDGMLLPYVEDVKLIFVADTYAPGAYPGMRIPFPPFAALARELHQALVSDLKLDVQAIAGAHGPGGTVTMETLKSQAGL